MSTIPKMPENWDAYNDRPAPATTKPRAGEHTKVPWTMYANSPGDDALPSVMANNPQGGLFYVAQCNNKEDAQRIVACVNACEGMLTENLEGTSMDQIYRQLREERDSLRECERELKKLLQECLDMSDNWPGVAYSYDLESRAKAALAND